jgi:2-methylcitrate dehydratase PrpD
MAELRGEPQATVIGLDERLPAANAALANAMLCHALDFDDSHADSISKVSTVVAPAALAVAEARGTSGRETLVAIVAGNETVTRLGMAASGAFHQRGFHPTSVCGIFGATAAVSRLTEQDARSATSALGIAGSLAGGIMASMVEGVPTKVIHPGWAAHGSILAARLAALGAEGPRSVLDGKFGLYHAFLGVEPGAIDLDGQLGDLGSRWETRRIAYKPFPACHFMHGSLQATAGALGGQRYRPDEIAEVLVRIPAAGVSLCLEPAAARRVPHSDYEAKFSLQYSVATMLVRGHVSVADFTDEAIADPEVLAVAAKVGYETREYSTYPGAFPGGVRVRLADGRLFEAECLYQKGSPDAPMSAEEVRAKFRENATLALDDRALQALEDAVLTLDDQADLAKALAPLSLAQLDGVRVAAARPGR